MIELYTIVIDLKYFVKQYLQFEAKNKAFFQ